MAIIEDVTSHATASVGPAAAAASLSVVPASDAPLNIGYPTIGTPIVLAISGTSAATAVLAAGKYLLWSEVTCGWRQGAGTPTAVLATDVPLSAGMPFPVTLAAQKLAAITGGASGNLYLLPVS